MPDGVRLAPLNNGKGFGVSGVKEVYAKILQLIQSGFVPRGLKFHVVSGDCYNFLFYFILFLLTNGNEIKITSLLARMTSGVHNL